MFCKLCMLTTYAELSAQSNFDSIWSIFDKVSFFTLKTCTICFGSAIEQQVLTFLLDNLCSVLGEYGDLYAQRRNMYSSLPSKSYHVNKTCTVKIIDFAKLQHR